MKGRFRIGLVASFVLLALTGCSGGGSAESDSADLKSSSSSSSQIDPATKKPGRFTQLKKGPTDTALAKVFTAGQDIDGALLGAYRFNMPGPEATDPVAREKRVKEVMHRFMCTFFDDSIDLKRPSGSPASRTQRTLADLDMNDNANGQDDAVRKFTDGLTDAYGDEKLDILSGGASGNNTIGNVMGAYDVANNQILYFGFSNCGSDG
jgi:hypothetical protein